MRVQNILLIISLVILVSAQAAMIEITDQDVKNGGIINWTANNTYLLHGKIFIRDGVRLNIEAGTTIYADNNSGAKATLLVISRGGRIYAEGTPTKPIIFTSIFDTSKILLPVGNLSRGLWGGIQICGRAQNNFPGGIGTKLLEDVTVKDSSLLLFGASPAINNDTSGVLRYVSIRYTGMTDKAEIKGFVLASVGKGTIIDHIETFCGLEDGIDLYGGTVDIKHAAFSFNGGDGLFYNYGYTGRIQFLFTIQTVIPGGQSNGTLVKIESNETPSEITSNGTIFNGTFIGTGKNNPDTWKYKYGIYYKKNGAGTLANSIITECSNYGIYVDSTTDPLLSSRARLSEGKIQIKNNLFYNFGRGNTVDSIAKGVASLQAHLNSNANDFMSPELNALSWPSPKDSFTLKSDYALDPRPLATGKATQNLLATPEDGFFEKVSYRGAFNPQGSLWLTGWSTLYKFGLLKPEATSIRSAKEEKKSNIKLLNNGRNVQLNWLQQNSGLTVISIYDLSGKLIKVVENKFYAQGLQTVTYTSKWLDGIYMIRVKQPGLSQTISATNIL